MKKGIVAVFLIVIFAVVINVFNGEADYFAKEANDADIYLAKLVNDIAKTTNAGGLFVRIDGALGESEEGSYLTDELFVMMSVSDMRERLGLDITENSDKEITITQGISRMFLTIGDSGIRVNGQTVDIGKAPEEKDGRIYLPVELLGSYLHYDTSLSVINNTLDITKLEYEEELPKSYDLRAEKKVTPVRDQGKFGTCWAFASLGALETVTMPDDEEIYSVDHMNYMGGFNVDAVLGGDYTMAMSYLAGWYGPVLEKDDIYGDEKANERLLPVKHLEEARLIPDKNYDRIKECLVLYGGVQTSIYISGELANLETDAGKNGNEFYDTEHSCYYYDGNNSPNHAVVIVGWDDDYPKSNFKKEPKENGAFICKNSWGTDFGDQGFFYVSYEDVNIGTVNIVYTALSDTSNYDSIYQSDKLGWVGQLGFDAESAYFANVYKAEDEEYLKAVGFYATDQNTRYSVYVVTDFTDKDSLVLGDELASGEFSEAGYYTVRLDEAVKLDKNEKFAVVVYVNTPGAKRPVAVEYAAGAKTADADISDGESYISLTADKWSNVEMSQGGNVCLKAYTDRKED